MVTEASMARVTAALLLAISLTLSACAGKPPKPAEPTAPREVNPGGEGAGAASPSAAAADDEAAGPQAGLLANRLIYFDFDSAEIKGEGIGVVAAHAKYLAAHGNVRVRLEGHTDERGSREYNIGLGERRAQSVRRALLLQGVADAQMSTVSYGEERPAAPGHDEAAWAKNRRVEIVYLSQPLPPH
jgi:peptidoglycan-associated lipoprotein